MLRAIWFSIWESSLTVIVSLLIGGSLALLEHHWNARTTKWFSVFMAVPIFLPPALVAVGFISVWGQTGYINIALQWLHIPSVHILYSPLAIILAHSFYNVPLAYLAIHIRLQSISHQLEHTVSSLGGSRWQAWRLTIWPRLRSTIIGVSVLIFLYAFMSFALPLILGGVRYRTVEVYLYSLITQQLDFKTAGLVALGQWAGLTLVIVLSLRNFTVFSEHQLHLSESNGGWPTTIITLCKLLLVCYILAPLAGIIFDSFPIKNFIALSETQFWSAWQRSFIIAITVTLLTLLIGVMITLQNKPWLNKLCIVFLAISPVTLSLILLLLVGKSLLVLVVVYTLSLLPIVSYLLLTSWQARPKFFDNTLKMLGANTIQHWRLNFSWLRPSLIQAASLSIAFVLGDITLANLLAPYNTPLAMSLSAGYINSYHFNLAAAGMVVVLFTIIIVILLINSPLLNRRGARGEVYAHR